MKSSSSRKWLWVLLSLLAAVAIAVPVVTVFLRNGRTAAADPPPTLPANHSVGCMGRVEPEGGVIRVSAAYYSGRPSRVAELKVREGDWVSKGQVLAILDSHGVLEAAIRQGEARRGLARSRLRQVRAGAKPEDIAALEAELARWQVSLKNAQAEYARYEPLFRTHDVSASDLDAKRLAVETTERTVEQTRHRLDSLSKVREVDLNAAEAEVRAASADLDNAKAQCELSSVRAPQQGRILKIHAKPGEEVGPDGVLEMGDTRRMVVIAEVYETDISKIHLQQRATVTSEAIPGKLEGFVEDVGSEVAKNSLLPTDPAAFYDARVVKVKVLVPDSQALANLIYGKVDVVFHP